MNTLVTGKKYKQEIPTSGCTSVEVAVGTEVLALISDKGFQSEWDKLYEQCSWGTVFQSREYVSAWYQVYSESYIPILVKGICDNKLVGLLALCKGSKKSITGAGAEQAEYQVWLASASNGEAFIQKALVELGQQFPKHPIHLKYVPGNAPLQWAESNDYWGRRSWVRTVKQPLLTIDEDRICTELRKKNRREKINRLRRLGELQFERLTDSVAFAQVFDEIALQYDFRKGAMFNARFFQADPLRKEFLLKLFQLNLLHTTILKLNDEVIASNVGVTGKRWVHLQGINSHAPTYAKYSPGILHFLMLGRLLGEEGIEVFDLTPGADSYKEGLATDHTYAREFIVDNRFNKLIRSLKSNCLNKIKANASKVDVDLRGVKRTVKLFEERIKQFKKYGLLKSLKLLFSNSHSESGFKTFYIEKHSQTSHSFPFNENSLRDLLDFDGSGSLQTRWEFLEEAMRGLEQGDCCYTWGEGGRLLACVWQERPRQPEAAGTAVLRGLYCHPAGRSRLRDFLGAVAGKVAGEKGEARVCLAVRASDKETSKVFD